MRAWAVVWLLLGGAAASAQPDPAAWWTHVERAAAEVPRDRFDPAAVVAEVGADPVALFAWVRDRTRGVAYRGVLKGPVGVLLDRAGNPLDRALLLRALLNEAGHVAFIAVGPVPDGGDRPQGPAAPLPPTNDPDELAARAGSDLGVDAAALALALHRANAAGAAEDAAWTDEAARLSGALLAVLGPAEAAAAGADDEHWWVVLLQPDGTLLDLDPSLPDAEPGDRRVEARDLFDPVDLEQLVGLDGACPDITCGTRLHTLTIRAIAEVVDGGRLVEEVLVEHHLLPAQSWGQPIRLSIAATLGDPPPDPFAEAAAGPALLAALATHREWRPSVEVGAAFSDGRVVAANGAVADLPTGRVAAERGSLGGFGSFGGGLGGGGADDGAAAPEVDPAAGGFTALWWEFVLRTPPRGTIVERREVFDLIGPAARAAGVAEAPSLEPGAALARALALAGETEVGAWPAALDATLLDTAALTRLAADRDAWDALRRDGIATPAPELNARLAAMAGLRTPLERFALERGRAVAAQGHGAQTGLLVVALHRRLRPDLTAEAAFDLVALPAHAAAGAFADRVRGGVVDALLESRVARAAWPDARPEPSLTAAFARDPSAWRLARDPSDLADLARLDADLAARVAADLAAGRIAVVPTTAADAVGWWRVDPRTGAAVSVGNRGWGQLVVENAVELNVIVQLRTVVNQYAAMGQCLGYALVQPLQGIEGVGVELAGCILKLVCGQVNTAVGGWLVPNATWTNVIVMATLDALWGGVPEVGFGGFCGGVWERLASGGSR